MIAANVEVAGKAFKALKHEQIGKMQVATRRRMRNYLYATHGKPISDNGDEAVQAI
jgi:hypothetical protein